LASWGCAELPPSLLHTCTPEYRMTREVIY
jgi:hypothetical protein